MENLSPLGPRSSLPFQLTLWADMQLQKLFGFIVILLLFVKPYFFVYPAYAAQGEMVLMVLHLLLQPVRHWFATAGNKQEKPFFIAVSLWTIPLNVLVCGYFWKRQTYGLAIECNLAAAALGFAAAETLGGGVAGVSFCDNVPDLINIVMSTSAAVGSMVLVWMVY
eukprot:TRINITY_DN24588_c0_g1_i1.p1 TRINITY_DN24588_c0_g1~~TRINITY_DN24588_c0_g1_i1.p1  ORF type:complete len:166 (+),score=32.40 TRINITY_DN24588_c0_g1_i1:45-542(+)